MCLQKWPKIDNAWDLKKILKQVRIALSQNVTHLYNEETGEEIKNGCDIPKDGRLLAEERKSAETGEEEPPKVSAEAPKTAEQKESTNDGMNDKKQKTDDTTCGSVTK